MIQYLQTIGHPGLGMRLSYETMSDTDWLVT